MVHKLMKRRVFNRLKRKKMLGILDKPIILLDFFAHKIKGVGREEAMWIVV